MTVLQALFKLCSSNLPFSELRLKKKLVFLLSHLIKTTQLCLSPILA